MLYLKVLRRDVFFFYCPMCGVAWAKPPDPERLETINSLADLAPEGVSLPIDSDARACSFPLETCPLADWLGVLHGDIQNQIPMPSWL